MFKGLRPVSFVDWPGRMATVLFTAGCNFDCAWCHNRGLVEPERYGRMPDLSWEEIRAVLTERKDFIDGVCVTGGEPLLHGVRLREALRRIRDETGLPVKLDTNGSLPDELGKCYDENLVAFTAMDIKNSFEKYGSTVSVPKIDCGAIERSIALIRSCSPAWEFRITQVPGLVEEGDIRWIEERFGLTLTVQEYRRVGEPEGEGISLSFSGNHRP